MSESPDAFLTVKQVATFIALTPAAVYRICDSGRLICHRFGVGRGAVRIRQSELDAYIERCRAAPPEQRELDKHLAGLRLKRRRDALTKKFNLKYLRLPKGMEADEKVSRRRAAIVKRLDIKHFGEHLPKSWLQD